MNEKDEQNEGLWKYIIRITIKPLIFFVVLYGVVSYWNARDAEKHKVIYKKIEQQIQDFKLMETKEPLNSVLKKRSRESRAWLSNEFESNYERQEIVAFYEQMLSDAGWSKFEHKEYYVKYKSEDNYASKKNGYMFSLAFTYDAPGKNRDKDKSMRYHIFIGRPLVGD